MHLEILNLEFYYIYTYRITWIYTEILLLGYQYLV